MFQIYSYGYGFLLEKKVLVLGFEYLIVLHILKTTSNTQNHQSHPCFADMRKTFCRASIWFSRNLTGSRSEGDGCCSIFQIWMIHFLPSAAGSGHLTSFWSLSRTFPLFPPIDSCRSEKLDKNKYKIHLCYQHLHLPGLGVKTKRGACPSSCDQVSDNNNNLLLLSKYMIEKLSLCVYKPENLMIWSFKVNMYISAKPWIMAHS